MEKQFWVDWRDGGFWEGLDSTKQKSTKYKRRQCDNVCTKSGTLTVLTPVNQQAVQMPETAAMIQSGKETKPVKIEELAKITLDNFKNLGVDTTKPFVLRVNYENKIYEIPVKSIVHKGRIILGPIVSPLNRQLRDFIFKVPAFAPYVAYRMEKESLFWRLYLNGVSSNNSVKWPDMALANFYFSD